MGAGRLREPLAAVAGELRVDDAPVRLAGGAAHEALAFEAVEEAGGTALGQQDAAGELAAP